MSFEDNPTPKNAVIFVMKILGIIVGSLALLVALVMIPYLFKGEEVDTLESNTRVVESTEYWYSDAGTFDRKANDLLLSERYADHIHPITLIEEYIPRSDMVGVVIETCNLYPKDMTKPYITDVSDLSDAHDCKVKVTYYSGKK